MFQFVFNLAQRSRDWLEKMRLNRQRMDKGPRRNLMLQLKSLSEARGPVAREPSHKKPLALRIREQREAARNGLETAPQMGTLYRAQRIAARYPELVPMALLFLLASLIAVVFHHYLPAGLSVEGMDSAQISRNIAAGHGYSTNVVQPIVLGIVGSRTYVPELSAPPIYPLLLCPFSGGGDGPVSGLSLALFVLSAVLLYVAIRRLSESQAISFLVVVVYCLSRPVLTSADSGGPAMLVTCLLLWLLILAPGAEAPLQQGAAYLDVFAQAVDEAGKRRFRPQIRRRYLAMGALTGVIYLTQYTALLFTIPLLLFWGHGPRQWNRRTIGSFFLGFSAIALLWWIRNYRLTGNPFFTLQWWDLAAGVSGDSGTTLFRQMSPGGVPSLGPLLPDVLGLLRRLAGGVADGVHELIALPHSILAPFVLVGWWLRSDSRSMQSCKAALLAAIIVALPALALLGQSPLPPLIPLGGLLGYLGVRTLLDLTDDRLRSWLHERVKDEYRRITGPGTVVAWRALMVGGLLLLLTMPLIIAAIFNAGARPVDYRKALAPVAQAVGPDAVIATDAPWQVAWYTGRKTLWLPSPPSALKDASRLQPVTAIYLSSDMLKDSAADGFGDWQQIYSQGSAIGGFTRLTRPRMGDVLYTELPTFAQLRKVAGAQPDNPTFQLQLAQAQLQRGKAAGALATYEKVEQLEPNKPLGFVGAGYACLQLKDLVGAKRHLATALKLDPHNAPALLGMGEVTMNTGDFTEAARLYEAVLADYPEQPVALNNLAFLYSREGQNLDRALEMARRAAASNPDSGDIRDTLGWVLFRSGRLADAVPQLQEAVRLAPNDGLAWYHLGKSLRATGKIGEALDAFRTALSHNLPATEAADARAQMSG